MVFHDFASGTLRLVHVTPLFVPSDVAGLAPEEEVMTRLEIPLFATATNNPFPYTTPCQLTLAELVLLVQVIPSREVITLLLATSYETATKIPFP